MPVTYFCDYFCTEMKSKNPGGGYLVYFADGICTPFRVSIRLFFLTPGIELGHLF